MQRLMTTMCIRYLDKMYRNYSHTLFVFELFIKYVKLIKVETIGDAYMVVGGAPVRSPDHVDQIATMALDLLHESGKFRIRHLPYTPLRLRIGIHTGKRSFTYFLLVVNIFKQFYTRKFQKTNFRLFRKRKSSFVHG